MTRNFTECAEREMVRMDKAHRQPCHVGGDVQPPVRASPGWDQVSRTCDVCVPLSLAL